LAWYARVVRVHQRELLALGAGFVEVIKINV
jgi:hypothetical protein